MSETTDYSGYARQSEDGAWHLTLAVEGMHCPACAFRIENTLQAEGAKARVNVTEKRLALDWTGDAATGNGLVKKAESLGFLFSPLREGAEAKGEKERLSFLMRCIAVSGFASGNVMLFSLALWFSTPETMTHGTRALMHWFSALVSMPAVIYAGRPFFDSAWRALKNGRTNMDVPISVAVILATAASLVETIRGGPHVYFDSAVMLLFLLLIGRYLDAKMRARAKGAAGDLLALMSGTASVVESTGLRRVPAGDIRPGMTLSVARGEKILADGACLSPAMLDTSAITGETLPRAYQAGETVLAGMINLGDTLTVRVDKSQEKSLMGEIILLMRKAEQGNARFVQLADRIARWYTPVVHLLALITFLGWFFLSGAPWMTGVLCAVTVLVITCPCALGLAVPVTQVIAGGALFKDGALLKSGDALERLARVDTVVFDKTGTLTDGKIAFENAADLTDEEKSLIAPLAAASRHPLAQAVTKVLGGQSASGAREVEGQGVEANGTKLGSAAFTGAPASADDRIEMWFARPGHAPRRLVFSDAAHADAAETVARLKKTCRVILLSGDRPAVAARMGAALGFDEWRGGVSPRDKHDFIAALRTQGRKVLMVGDGLNDAAALSQADVSMSPSSALDIAQNAADVVYQARGLGPIFRTLETARKTERIVRQNFAMALGYNVIAVPLAMAGKASPLVAAIAMSASSLAVVFNALRMRKG